MFSSAFAASKPLRQPRRRLVIEDAMRRDPALFNILSNDPRFHVLLRELDEAFATLRSPNTAAADGMIAAKRAMRAQAPFQQDYYDLQRRIAEKREWDLRPAERRPALVFDDVEPAADRRTFDEVFAMSRTIIKPEMRIHFNHLRQMAIRQAEKEDRRPNSPQLFIVIQPKAIIGYPTLWQRLLRPALAQQKIETCQDVAATLSSEWTAAKDTYRENLALRRMEAELPRFESVMRFVAPYVAEIDEYNRKARLSSIQEDGARRDRERASASTRDTNARPQRQSRAQVIELSAYLRGRRERRDDSQLER